MNDAARYDALLEAGHEPPAPCPVCTGDMYAEPCGEECAGLIARCEREKRIRGLYEAARRALRLAREYRIGDATSDFRVRAIARQVYHYRMDIAALRAA